jgi:hypothetical protein
MARSMPWSPPSFLADFDTLRFVTIIVPVMRLSFPGPG